MRLVSRVKFGCTAQKARCTAVSVLQCHMQLRRIRNCSKAANLQCVCIVQRNKCCVAVCALQLSQHCSRVNVVKQ